MHCNIRKHICIIVLVPEGTGCSLQNSIIFYKRFIINEVAPGSLSRKRMKRCVHKGLSPFNFSWSFYFMYSQTLQLLTTRPHSQKPSYTHHTRLHYHSTRGRTLEALARVPIIRIIISLLSPGVPKPAFVCNLICVYV